MKNIGLNINFNWWFIVVPVLVVLGLSACAVVFQPGEEKAEKILFGWKTDRPVEYFVLFYSVVVGVVTGVMTWIESHLGVIESLGRDNPYAIMFAPVIVLTFSAFVGYALFCGMIWVCRKRRRALKLRWKEKKKAQLRRESLREALNSPDIISFRAPVTMDNVVASADFKRARRRRKIRLTWHKWVHAVSYRFHKKLDEHDPMSLPEDVVRKYRQTGTPT